MDIEGAEFNVLNHMQADVASQIKKFVAEVHLSSGDIALLRKKLLTLGFRVFIFKPPIVRKSTKVNVVVHNLHKLKIAVICSKLLRRLNIHAEGVRILFAEKN